MLREKTPLDFIMRVTKQSSNIDGDTGWKGVFSI